MTTATHQSIASRLSDEAWEGVDKHRSSGYGSAQPALSVLAGERIAGATFDPRGKAEEEFGINDVFKAFMIRDKETNVVDRLAQPTGGAAIFVDVNAIVISSQPLPFTQLAWGESLYGSDMHDRGTSYAVDWERSLAYDQGYLDEWDLKKMKMEPLREVAAKVAIDGKPSRNKAELIDQILATGRMHDAPTRPDQWPAWFRNGREMILRADRGTLAPIIEGLREAIVDDQLAIAGRAFGRNFGFVAYDWRDATPAIRGAMTENLIAYRH